ncbi:MAG: DUF1616 domain-containing protein [Candidatus Bathyarchaeia archaeon]
MTERRPPQTNSRENLDEMILKYVQAHRGARVQDVYEGLILGNRFISKSEVADSILRLAEQEKIELEEIPPRVASLTEYLKLWDRNLWLYGALTVSVFTSMAIYAIPPQSQFIWFRWVLGSAFVILIPGYVMVEALFLKSSDMDMTERVALSIGLSLTLVPLTGLLLNFSPWGITLLPIVITLNILTFGLSAIAFARRYRQSRADQS